MGVQDWGRVVTDEAELRELVGEPAPAAVAKQRDHLHDLDRAWLAASPFCLLATAGADGRCDVSPKGDPPGFVRVLDERTVVVPERPGNRRVDGFRNLLANPHAGLISVLPGRSVSLRPLMRSVSLPGRSDTLRINGRAVLVRDAPFFDDMVVKGHRPLLAVVIEVEEVFHHCSKAFLRSSLWDTATWDGGAAPVAAGVPSRAHIARALERPDTPLEELQSYYGPRYADGLYR